MDEKILGNIRHFNTEIQIKKDRLAELRENTVKMNKQLKEDKVQSSVRSGFEEKLLDALQLEKSLIYDINLLYSQKAKVYEAIRDIKNVKIKNVMILYYLSETPPTVKEISEELCYTIDYVKKLKSKGVKLVLDYLDKKK